MGVGLAPNLGPDRPGFMWPRVQVAPAFMWHWGAARMLAHSERLRRDQRGKAGVVATMVPLVIGHPRLG